MNVLIEDLIQFFEKLNYKRSRIFFFGFSQGAALCSLFLLTSKDKFGGFIAISPSCMSPIFQFTSNSSIQTETPLYFSHGTLDDKISSKEASNNVRLNLIIQSTKI